MNFITFNTNSKWYYYDLLIMIFNIFVKILIKYLKCPKIKVSFYYWCKLMYSNALWYILINNDAFWCQITFDALINTDVDWWYLMQWCKKAIWCADVLMHLCKFLKIENDAYWCILMLFDVSDTIWCILIFTYAYWCIMMYTDEFWSKMIYPDEILLVLMRN